LRTAIIVGMGALLLTMSGVVVAQPSELEPLAFLVGEWTATGSGQPGVASGTAVFRRDLQDRVILRTSYAEYPPADGKPGSRHDDLMIIYVASVGKVRADYYDSEGHVIRYTVRSPAAGQAVFLSEAAEGQPTFRLSYKLEADGTLQGGFEIAPPGTPEAFNSYLTWRSRKATGVRK
jgi:hypothetical protein